MDKEPAEHTSFLTGINDFWESEFPKKCVKCGKTYPTFLDFVHGTQPSEGRSDLMEYENSESTKIVGIFRNCSCGSTLMIQSSNRRDTSEAGERRRRVFGALLGKLVAGDLPEEQARQKLLKILASGQLDDLATRLLKSDIP